MRTLATLMLALACTLAQAQSYPSRPITFVVPFGAGGPADIYARFLGQKMQASLGQFVVENRPGGGSVVGSNHVAQAAPDGYTLLVMSNTHTVNETLIPKKPFELMRDFAPITGVNYSDLLMVIHPSVPAANLEEFIALAKSKPGVLNYGISGIATSTHMAGELFMHMTGIQMVGIPYKGGAPGMTALLGGQIQLYFATISTAIPHIRGGKLRALAVTTAKRSVAAPEYPTIAEAGVPGYEHASWVGFLAPAGLPQKVLFRLNGESAKAVQSQDIRALLLRDGLEPVGNSPREFERIIKTEIAKWNKVARVANIKAQ